MFPLSEYVKNYQKFITT